MAGIQMAADPSRNDKEMLAALAAFMPIDRRHALATGAELPTVATGAALFADISGFTPLTEGLVRALGPQRGAEELTHYLNTVYDSLISELYRFGGSLISFSGDAISCWLDGDTGSRAVACALAMQEAMVGFAALPMPNGDTVSLALKVAVAAGSVRRLVVGDPDIQLIDAMTGRLLDQLADTEHLANKGEVVVSAATAEALGDLLADARWRVEDGTGTMTLALTSLGQ
jgi:class 3 adenylate cyclase